MAKLLFNIKREDWRKIIAIGLGLAGLDLFEILNLFGLHEFAPKLVGGILVYGVKLILENEI